MEFFDKREIQNAQGWEGGNVYNTWFESDTI